MKIREKLAIQKIKNDNVEKAVFKALELINAKKLMNKENMKILLKPNLLSPKLPERAVTTHPSVVRSVIRWLKQFNPSKIYVGDSSAGKPPDRTLISLKTSGIKAVCDEENVTCLPLEKSEREIYKVEDPYVLDEFASSVLLKEVDLIINLPKIKTHGLTLLTCCIKNMFGTVLLFNKGRIHARFTSLDDFSSVLVDVYSVSKPQLTVVDGFLCQEGRGPAAGKVVKLDLIIAGFDGVGLDTLVCKIIGINPLEVKNLKKAEDKNLGSTNLNEFEILGDSVKSVSRQFKLPKIKIPRLKLPRKIGDYVGRVVFKSDIKIDGSKCVLCGKCWQNCPVNALTSPDIIKKGNVPKWNKKECISCYCCTELCPEEAIEFKIKPLKNALFSWIGVIGIGGILSLILLILILSIIF